MSPITADVAYAATDPSLAPEQRQEMATRIMQGVAANDAYYDSRSPLEQIVAQAQGAGEVKTHEELNPSAAIGGGGKIVDAEVVEADETAQLSSGLTAEEQAELDAANERVAALEARRGK